MFERDNGYLVVDEVFYDAQLIDFVDVKIGDTYYRFRALDALGHVSDDMLRPTLKATPYSNDDGLDKSMCRMYGLILRNYKPSIGRAITPDEWNTVVDKYHLTDDTISDEYDESMPKCHGEAHAIHFTARQVKVEKEKAIGLESDLKKIGIEAFNGCPERVTIRVK